MSLQFTRPEFHLCPSCAAKPGSPNLCVECLERRELWQLAYDLRDGRIAMIASARVMAKICLYCSGAPNPECPEHGR